MNILDRLEEIRINERLKKKDFEEIIGKSSGYIGTLKKNEGVPGSDVLIKISDYFRNKYNLDWILTGEGEMLKDPNGYPKNAESHDQANIEENITLQSLHADIKRDLAALSQGVTYNFEVVGRGVLQTIKDQQKILKFIDQLDVEKIKKASVGLDEFLKENKS